MNCKFCKLARDLEKRGDMWRDIAVALSLILSLMTVMMAASILIK